MLIVRKSSTAVLIILSSAIFLSPLPSSAADPPLKLIASKSKSVVKIEVFQGALFSEKPQGIRNPKTGQILIIKKIRRVDTAQKGIGVILSQDGIIVTNAHTVKKPGRIMVNFLSKERVEAKIVYINERDDLALLSITPPFPLTPITFADSDSIKPQAVIYTLGHSEWIQGSVSGGNIQAIGTEKINNQDHITFLQMNFRAYKGDSGSPVLNEEGKLIGIIAAGQLFHNVTYAIASDVIWGAYQKYLTNQNLPPAIPAPRGEQSRTQTKI